MKKSFKILVDKGVLNEERISVSAGKMRSSDLVETD